MSKQLEDHLIAIKTDRLLPGMFVAALDRLWLHTPFPPDGFYIRDQKQLDKICRFCTFVYIDPLKGEDTIDVIVPFEQIPSTSLAPINTHNSISEELPWAREAVSALTDAVRQTVHDVRCGRLPDLENLRAGVKPVIDSIERCADAMLWLSRIEPVQGYLYRRSVGSAITAIVFGNKLGFDEAALFDLGMGGVLMDIGKTEVPVTILAKTDNLTSTERNLVRKHVCHAMDIVKLLDNVPPRVVEMVASHHERFDGSGYPNKQRGTEIPLFARIAGIVDTYDAITQDRRYAPAISAHTALRYLNGQRRTKFDAALLQEFIHAMGVYPTGTWVELMDGSIGVVCAQDKRWPLTPRVALMTDQQRQPQAPRTVLADRLNPIVGARHSQNSDLDAPDLEAIA
jgi:HD-GYP domain-containing protein (c-di-GMP phosphodiesterase class II)